MKLKRNENHYNKYGKTHYQTHKADYLARVANRKKIGMKFLMDYKSIHPCMDCGYENPIALEFDHLPKFKKHMEVSKMVQFGYSIARIKEEILKCEVVCANCHRIRTFTREQF